MAHSNSALKRDRQNKKTRVQTRAVRSTVKTAVRKVRESVEAADLDKARDRLKRASSALDNAVRKGVLHKKNASRRKSRLSALVNKAAVSK